MVADLILISRTAIIMNFLDFIASSFFKEDKFFKQLTIWNIVTQVLDCTNPIAIVNSFNILIVFHLFFLFQPELYYVIPSKCNLSITQFHIVNILLHLLPCIISIYYLISTSIHINIINGIYNILYILVWLCSVKMDYSIYSINKYYVKHLICIYLSLIIFWIKMI